MSWRNLIWLSIVLLLAGLALYLSRRQGRVVQPLDPAASELAGAVEAYKLIQRQAYRPLEPHDANSAAAGGMIRQLDDFCVHIPPGQTRTIERRLDGELDETGLRIARRGDALVVVGALPGSPAQQAALPAGAEIVRIGDQPAEFLTLAQARSLLEQARRDDLEIEVRHDNRRVVRRIPAARFQMETVTGLVRRADGGWDHVLDERRRLAYVRIEEFTSRTPSQLQDAWSRLNKPAGVVLDLRGNPGGALTVAVEVADRFLEAGLIVRVVGRHERAERFARAEGTFPDVPLVVLVDEQTASAAEIVAGSLQRHGRAELVGCPTLGKWCVQSPIDLGRALGSAYMTTGEYELAPTSQPASRPATQQPTRAATAMAAATATAAATVPKGRLRHAGLAPDLFERLTVAQAERLDQFRLEAKVVAFVAPTTAPAGKSVPRDAQIKKAILKDDRQLAAAAALLAESSKPVTSKTSDQ